MRLLLALVAVIYSTFAFAENKDRINLDRLNEIINQTNFIVNNNCSGTLIDLKNKLILTNYHCIDSNVTMIEKEETDSKGRIKKVKSRKYVNVPVSQNTYQGFDKVGSAEYITEIVAENKYRDLALLQIKGDNIPYKFASRIIPDSKKIVRGEKVYVVGNPAMMDASIVEGVISNLNRTFEFPWTDNEKLPMIQFSGGIYGGNSGGALYDSEGNLIGVPAAGFNAATFIGLAIPHTIIKKFLKDKCFAEAYDDKADNEKCEEKKKDDEREEIRKILKESNKD